MIMPSVSKPVVNLIIASVSFLLRQVCKSTRAAGSGGWRVLSKPSYDERKRAQVRALLNQCIRLVFGTAAVVGATRSNGLTQQA